MDVSCVGSYGTLFSLFYTVLCLVQTLCVLYNTLKRKRKRIPMILFLERKFHMYCDGGRRLMPSQENLFYSAGIFAAGLDNCR